MKFDTLRGIAAAIAAGNMADVQAAISAALETETGPAWRRDLAKLADVARDGQPRFRIIAVDGNSKLPFAAFSALPGTGFCPGAGDCLKFCYSFRAWRYPAAFARQAQNSILLRTEHGRQAIRDALDAVTSPAEPMDFRLYVDGDFGSVADVAFWFAILRTRPWIRAYGYSKSWRQILAYADTGAALPANYRLNLSSGSVHGPDVEARIAALPITRGRFVAVPLGRAVKSADHGNREHQATLRAAYGRKAFTCPGKCGACTNAGHACGSARFAGIDIIIATH